VTSDQHLGEATYGESERHRKTNAAEVAEWHTASHVERQPKAKKPATPQPNP
jgi:Leu/Phe-tRNA-protein transferase